MRERKKPTQRPLLIHGRIKSLRKSKRGRQTLPKTHVSAILHGVELNVVVPLNSAKRVGWTSAHWAFWAGIRSHRSAWWTGHTLWRHRWTIGARTARRLGARSRPEAGRLWSTGARRIWVWRTSWTADTRWWRAGLNGFGGEACTRANTLLGSIQTDAECPTIVILVEQPDDFACAEFEFIGHRWLEVNHDTVNW